MYKHHPTRPSPAEAAAQLFVVALCVLACLVYAGTAAGYEVTLKKR